MSSFGEFLKSLKEKIGPPGEWFGDFTRTPVWKSLFRHKLPQDPKNRALVVLTNVFLHLHPVRMRKQGLRISYTWCMGGISFFLFLSLTVTGILLMFYYRPTAQHAYPDMLDLMESASLGLMREIEVLRAAGVGPTLRPVVQRRGELLRFLRRSLDPAGSL